MKRLILLFCSALLAVSAMTGCAGMQAARGDAQAQAVQARAEADKARSVAETARAEAEKAYIDGLRTMVAGAGDGPRLAAVMAAFTSRQSLAQSPPVMAAPVMSAPPRQPDLVDRGFQLLNLLLRGYEIDRSTEAAMHASDNARDIQLGAYGAIRDTAGEIQAPAASQTYTLTASGAGAVAGGGTGSYSAPSLGGPGVIGNGTYTANPQTQTTTGSYNPVNTTNTQGAP